MYWSLVITFYLLSLCLICPVFSQNCSEEESLALLQLSKSFTMDSTGITTSWRKDTDCCAWREITCSPTTHHVTGLELAGIIGTIQGNSSLFRLVHLESLNLAYNYFPASYISRKFGQFRSLRHLNLSSSDFAGQVPVELGQLSKLETLDLSQNTLEMLNFETIISNMTGLKRMDLSSITFDSAVFQTIANLSELTYLGLHSCQLQEEVPVKIFNLPKLKHLDIGENTALYSYFLLSNWSSPLQHLDLTSVNFASKIPSSPGQAPYTLLEMLILPGCGFYGDLPPWIWSIVDQTELTGSASLSSNITSRNLVFLDLSSNNFTGNISLYTLYSKLPKLIGLVLSDNALSVTTRLTSDIVTNFTWPVVITLGLASCKLTEIPDFLKDQAYLGYLDLAYNNIHGEIPQWLFQDKLLFSAVDLSHNFFTGRLINLPSTLGSIDVSYNQLEGALPIPAANSLWFAASNNNFTGSIPASICNLTTLMLLDLSNNSLQGDFHHCLGNLSNDLTVLNLGSNNIVGTLPSNFFKCSSLQYLDLNNNRLQGLVSRSLASCTSLQLVNLRGNELQDEFPYWLHSLPEIQVLDLSFNSLQGPITLPPKSTASFPLLQILDLDSNNFSGEIPAAYIRSFKAMMNITTYTGNDPRYMGSPVRGTFRNGYTYSIVLSFNGVQLKYEKIITTLSTFDVSNNAFIGHIPDSIGELITIHSLNFSHNQLTGPIPASVGNLKLLNSLDLSANRLNGKIPQELASSLTSLGVFNVSSNLLVGEIPHSNNFDTFEADSYQQNLGLCGFPLPGCGPLSTKPSTRNLGDHSSADGHILNMSEWQITLLAYGCGTLLGFAWGYYMLSVGNPFWLSKMAFITETAVLRFFSKNSGRQRKRARKINLA